MKKSRILAVAGVSLLAAGVLAACSNTNSNAGSSNAKLASDYKYVYSVDPETLDYVVNNVDSTSFVTTNSVDGLLANDKYGNLVPSIAESWTVSQDGLTYTYKIRKDAKWVTAEGEEYAPVKAQDFVTGLKHAVEGKSKGLSVISSSIKGLSAYINGETNDFSTVGVKAVDDNTLEYTLNQPETFWNDKTTNGVMMPINEDFLKSKGEGFGAPTDPSSILYNGPFVLKAITAKSSIEMAKNDAYWDKDAVKIQNIKFTFWDGKDQDVVAKGFSEGQYSKARIYPTSSTYEKYASEFKDNIYFSEPGSAIATVSVNYGRSTYNHTSKTTDSQKESTRKALLNKEFRQALNFAVDRNSYSAQTNGTEGAAVAIRNTFTPYNLPVGDKQFGELVEESLSKTNSGTWSNISLADSQNGLYNEEKAKAAFAKAKESLKAEGVEFPIHLDALTIQESTAVVNRVQSLKQSIENVLGSDNVVIDLQQMTQAEALPLSFSAPTAKEQDWDIHTLTGWNPDYQDPSTFLDQYTIKGGNTRLLMGIDKDTDASVIQKLGLSDYEKLVDEANKENQDVQKRYEKYALAQAWLTDNGLTIPVMAGPKETAVSFVSKVIPFTSSYSAAGLKGETSGYLKYTEVGEKPITKEEYQKAREKWLKEKAESNEKAQKELASHVK